MSAWWYRTLELLVYVFYFSFCVHLCVVCLRECLLVSVLVHAWWRAGLKTAKCVGVWGVVGGEKSAQDSFFLILYNRRGEEASVLFFLALALTALSGYWSGALMQTCQINFAGRGGCGCWKIASSLKGWGGWMEGWVKWFRGVRRKEPLNFYQPNGKRALLFLHSLCSSTFPSSVSIFCDFTHDLWHKCKIINTNCSFRRELETSVQYSLCILQVFFMTTSLNKLFNKLTFLLLFMLTVFSALSHEC